MRFLLLFLLNIHLLILSGQDMGLKRNLNFKPVVNSDLDSESILNWLMTKSYESEKKYTLLIPVTIFFEDSSHFQITNTILGETADNKSSNIQLVLKDGMLGISLFSRLQNLAPENSTQCTIWVEGVWGELFKSVDMEVFNEMSNNEKLNARWPFNLSYIHEHFPLENSDKSKTIIFIKVI